MRDMGRRRDPLQPRLRIIHLSLPAFHLYYVQLTCLTGVLVGVQHQRQFAASQAVDIRYFILTDEREETVFHDTAFYF